MVTNGFFENLKVKADIAAQAPRRAVTRPYALSSEFLFVDNSHCLVIDRANTALPSHPCKLSTCSSARGHICAEKILLDRKYVQPNRYVGDRLGGYFSYTLRH